MKKIIAKITGMMKYFKYLGKLVQALKILTDIIPQIMILVPEENRGALEKLVETLNSVSEAIEKAEKFLEKFGIDTSIDDEEEIAGTAKSSRSIEDNIKKLEAVAKGL